MIGSLLGIDLQTEGSIKPVDVRQFLSQVKHFPVLEVFKFIGRSLFGKGMAEDLDKGPFGCLKVIRKRPENTAGSVYQTSWTELTIGIQSFACRPDPGAVIPSEK